MTAPSWAPSLDHVADYITSRTLDTVTPGSDAPTGTFSASTYPTGTQVERLIEAACAWVTAVTGDVATTLEDDARGVAAMRTAGLVELSYPLRNDDISAVAQVLLDLATAGRDELVAANIVEGGVIVSQTPSPRGSFPDAPCYTLDGPAWGFPR